MTTKPAQAITLTCTCGRLITGLNEAQASYMLKQHKLSKKHKKAIRERKRA